MNRANIETWIVALESGEYSQTRLVLHDQTGFCCLGVLCDINNVEWVDAKTHGVFTYMDDMSHVAFPGDGVMEWVGLTREELTVSPFSLDPEQLKRLGAFGATNGIRLSNLNDYHFSFAEIAAIMRKEFLK